VLKSKLGPAPPVSVDESKGSSVGKVDVMRPDTELVVIVRHKIGVLSRLVRRRDALVALVADLRARYRGARGTSRLMVLDATDSHL
jgi:hypothetical protein